MPALPEGKIFQIKDGEFHFSVATSAMELMRGLKGVESLEPFHGMLFDFGVTMSVIMTPKGLNFPVELAFLNKDMEIVEISSLNPGLGFTVASTSKVYYSLEVPVGFFTQHNIAIGDKFTIKD